MLKKENKFDFRKRMFIVHPENIRDITLEPQANEIVLPNPTIIHIPDVAGEVSRNGVRDFIDFLKTSMMYNAQVSTTEQDAFISVKIDETYSEYKGFKAEVTAEKINIVAHDERGVAQAFFYLEEEMMTRKAPFLPMETTERKPLFAPRMVHSGYSIDVFPDEHLAQIAHAGMDAIMVMTVDVDTALCGEVDFDDLIRRAAIWGIDVYAYSYFSRTVHPDDPDADEHFDRTFGELFRRHPGFKGIILVGESIGFPSKDPNASPLPYNANVVDGIPTGIPSSDFWPCLDYREWLLKVQSVIFPHRPDADIVFWTYNWGYAPRDARQALIRALPPKVSLMVTFETFERYAIAPEVYVQVHDYSLAYVGPGSYFVSEAEVAKECGVKLYAMTNTAGTTWDMGGLPYEPMPGQWVKRAQEAIKCKEKYGLVGVMEGHQYGFTDSLVSDLMKYIYETDGEDWENQLRRIIKKRFGEGHVEEIFEALDHWSRAINYMPPTGEEQRGAFRVGPSFPFSIKGEFMPEADPESVGYFMMSSYDPVNRGASTLSGVRLPHERKMLTEFLALITKGCDILDKIPDKNSQLEYLCNMGHFMECFARTGINTKDWYIAKTRLIIESDKEKAKEYIAELEEIMSREKENILKTLPLVENDSRLGWDPRMGYVCDPARLHWKLRLFDYVERRELGGFKRGCVVTDKPNDGDDFEFYC